MIYKERLDVLLVNKGYFPSREKAQRVIMAGLVYVNGEKSEKAGTKYPEDIQISVKGDTLQYVSRGGLKLKKAIDFFSLDIDNLICFDIGASTGGFTDVLLQEGASKVYAIDVGYGELADKIRYDDRVVVMERTNARTLSLPSPCSFGAIDVSFISLKLILPSAFENLEHGGKLVALIKPQFEVGKIEASKSKGIIKDRSLHEKVIKDIVKFASNNGFKPIGLTFSPIKGQKGNIEFLVLLEKNMPDHKNKSIMPSDVSMEFECQQIRGDVADKDDALLQVLNLIDDNMIDEVLSEASRLV